MQAARGASVPAVSSASGSDLAARLRARDLSAAPEVLNLVENRAPAHRARDRRAARGRLACRAWRGGARARRRRDRPAGRRQVVAAVPARARVARPRPQRRGPRRRPLVAALGRIAARRPRPDRGDPGDRGVFVRSMAAGGRLGGLAPATRAAAHALAAAFDVVVIETVGVGQSETDVAEAADSVVVVVQPGGRRRPAVPEVGDHGDPRRARRDEGRPRGGRAALAPRPQRGAALARRRATRRVLAVSSLAPATGSRSSPTRSTSTASTSTSPRGGSRRAGASALADFTVEHGERGLRAIGGPRAAAKLLASRTRRSMSPR